MVRISHSISRFIKASLIVLAAATAIAALPPPDSAGTELHALLPLGAESFRIGPQHHMFAVLATAELPSFEGVIMSGERGKRRLLDRNGQPVRAYPRQVAFRVTASSRVKLFNDDQPYDLASPGELEPLLRSLSFQLKIFHRLQQRTEEPTAMRMIGVPADVPYDERIYQVQFALPAVPIEDSLVLEVLLPDGSRLCKFNLDFN
jgi:hypothetical protein